MNKRRKANKARDLAEYHYMKGNHRKALKQYLRMWKYNEWYGREETCLYNMAYCYRDLGDDTKALNVISLSLYNSCSHYESILMKKEILEDLGRNAEAEKYRVKIEEIDEVISNDNLLNQYLEHIE